MKMKKDTYIKVNITSKQKKLIQDAADRKGLTMPDYIRYQITKEIEEERNKYLNMLVKEGLEEYRTGKTVELKTDENIRNFHEDLMKE